MKTVSELQPGDRVVLHRGGWEYESQFLAADHKGYLIQVRSSDYRGDFHFFWDDVTAWIGDPVSGAQIVHHDDERLPVTVPDLE